MTDEQEIKALLKNIMDTLITLSETVDAIGELLIAMNREEDEGWARPSVDVKGVQRAVLDRKNSRSIRKCEGR